MTTKKDYKERYVHWNLKMYMYKQSQGTFQGFFFLNKSLNNRQTRSAAFRVPRHAEHVEHDSQSSVADFMLSM